MPTYRFKNKTTGEEWEEMMSHSKLDAYYKEHNCDQVIQAPQIISGHGEARLKTTDAFNDNLKEIKKKAGKGTKENPVTIGDSIR